MSENAKNFVAAFERMDDPSSRPPWILDWEI